MPLAVFVVRADCQLVYANPAAHRRLAVVGAPSLVEGYLAAPRHGDTEALRAFVGQVAGGVGAASGLVRLEGSDGSGVILRAHRLRSGQGDDGEGALMICTTAGLADRESFEAEALRLFGLTPAEARLAFVMAAGANAKEAARLLRVSPNTVRTHVKRIFEKTGARRQSDLPRLLGPLGLGPAGSPSL